MDNLWDLAHTEIWTWIFWSHFFFVHNSMMAALKNFQRIRKWTGLFSSSFLPSYFEHFVRIDFWGIFTFSPIYLPYFKIDTFHLLKATWVEPALLHLHLLLLPPPPVFHNLAISWTWIWLNLTLASCSSQECVTQSRHQWLQNPERWLENAWTTTLDLTYLAITSCSSVVDLYWVTANVYW